MPSPPIRRRLTITTWLVVSTVCMLLSPLILAAGGLATAVTRRPQPRLLARLIVEYFARELLVLIACGGLWLASGCGWRIRGPRFRRAHYGLLRWFVGGLAARARDLLDIALRTKPEPGAAEALSADRPVLVFSRHAAPGGRSPSCAAGEQMGNVLPPHPAGALAALRGHADSDVIFAAHTGLGLAAFPSQLWRDPPIGRTLTAHMWRARPDERPDDPEGQVDWLYDWWKRIDGWVEARGRESPPQ